MKKPTRKKKPATVSATEILRVEIERLELLAQVSKPKAYKSFTAIAHSFKIVRAYLLTLAAPERLKKWREIE